MYQMVIRIGLRRQKIHFGQGREISTRVAVVRCMREDIVPRHISNGVWDQDEVAYAGYYKRSWRQLQGRKYCFGSHGEQNLKSIPRFAAECVKVPGMNGVE